MTNYRQEFKRSLETAAHAAGVPIRKVCGGLILEEFLATTLAGITSPTEIAAVALHELCTDDGCYNGQTVAVMAAVKFLQKNARMPIRGTDNSKALEHLRAVLDGPNCDRVAILGWARQWYQD